MISAEQLAHFRENGWVVVEGVFTADEADEIAAIALEVSHTVANTRDDGYYLDRSEDGQVWPRKIDYPFSRHPAFRKFVLDPRLRDILKRLTGDEPLLCTDQIFLKPPRFGSAKPYHQDNFYFQCTPSDHVITAWIALDDVDEENGCLRYISGSHRNGILPHREMPGESYNLAPDPADIDMSREALAPVRKGGVVFHHSETLHTSHRNTSDRWRRGYATHWVTADVVSESGVLDNACFKHDDYRELIAPTVSTENR
ncbi:MAG: phytanoyl-CoA dioxygenase family protein [candidate division Zixibacteria bacterium]|nr:phytanoyl-CoA dioxygenase family protein [candidate division Zixibacteria bacterium]